MILHIRPPDIVVGGRIFYRDSFFFLSFFFFIRQLHSELAKRKSTKIGHMVESQCNLKMHVEYLGYPLPLQIGAKKLPFWKTSQLNSKFNGLCLRKETRYRQSVKCVDNHKGSPTSSQNVTNFGPQTASNSTAILPALCKFCFLRHCQGSQTEISKRNLTKLCQTADGKSR